MSRALVSRLARNQSRYSAALAPSGGSTCVALRSCGLQTRRSSTRDLGNGWLAIYSTEYQREYFWNRSTGVTTWQFPQASTPQPSVPPAASSPSQSVPDIPTAQAYPTPRAAAAVATGNNKQDSSAIASTPTADPGLASGSPAAAPAAAQSARQAEIADASSGSASSSLPAMTTRDLPEGWVAVFSSEENEYYYWHRPTGETSWTAPPRPQVSAEDIRRNCARAAAVLTNGPSLVEGVRLHELRTSVATARRRYNPGEELQADDFKLLRELLEYHPDCAAKVGVGVAAIKLDKSLHASESDCFWVLRGDGTAEDFSAKKCLNALLEYRKTRSM